LQWVTVLLSLIALFVAFKFRFVHDYAWYTRQWHNFLITSNPYFYPTGRFNGNAYGPLHITFSFFYQFHPALPRVIYGACWLGISWVIWLRFLVHQIPLHKIAILWIFLFLNPFFWSFYSFMGNNEIIVSTCLISGLYFLQKRQDFEAGICLGVGVLFKFVPIFLLPFWFLGKKKYRWEMLWGFFVTIVVGFGLAWLIWGRDLLEPFSFGTRRGPKFLSIFYYLESEFSFLTVFTEQPQASWLSLPLLALGCLFLMYWHYGRRIENYTITLIVLVWVYMLYKVNHPQFHTNILLLLPIWYLFNYPQIQKQGLDISSFLVYAVWLSVVQLLYVHSKLYDWDFDQIKWLTGLPTLMLSIWLLHTFISFSSKRAESL
jgi:hypothetical protein